MARLHGRQGTGESWLAGFSISSGHIRCRCTAGNIRQLLHALRQHLAQPRTCEAGINRCSQPRPDSLLGFPLSICVSTLHTAAVLRGCGPRGGQRQGLPGAAHVSLLFYCLNCKGWVRSCCETADSKGRRSAWSCTCEYGLKPISCCTA